MDKSTDKFINVSIFYESEGWHSLLNDCVLPCINLFGRQGFENEYLIYLNSDKGSNIRLSLKADQSDCKSILLNLDNHIRKFITQFPGPAKKVIYPLKNVFMDFPENSLQYNLFTAPGNCSRLPIRHLVSKNILEELAKDKLDVESLMAYDLYVHFQFLKSFGDVYGSEFVLREFLTELNGDLTEDGSKTTPDKISDELERTYENNKDVIREIYQMVFNGTGELQLKFLLEWDIEFKKLMKAIPEIIRSQSVLPVVQDHMGMSFIQKQFGYFSINKLLLEEDLSSENKIESTYQNNKEIV